MANKALQFNGTSHYVKGPAINLTFLDLSVTIKTAATSGHIVTKDDSAISQRTWGTGLNANGTITFYVYNQLGTISIINSATVVNNNTEYNLQFTWDGVTQKIFIDGVLDASVAFAGTSLKSSTEFILIGARRFTALTSFFTGIIDNVVIKDGADIVLVWALDEGTGTTAIDSSGNGNSATLAHASGSTNATWVDGLVGVPIIQSQAALEITTTSAQANGTLITNGGETITDQGFVWGTSLNPTTSDNVANVTPDTEGSFSADLTGLTDQTVYYYRAYLIYGTTTVYGENSTFLAGADAPSVITNAATDIRRTYVTGNGSVSSDGGADIYERGFVLGESVDPTTSDTKYIAAGTIGTFTKMLDNLTPSTDYHYRTYAINGAGVSYGDDEEFTTSANTAPFITDSPVTNYNPRLVKAYGNVTDDGGVAITERGFVLSTSANPTTSDTKLIISGTTGAYTGYLANLNAVAAYHYRSYAINSLGTSYGADQTFTTQAATAPRIIGFLAKGMAGTQATGDGNIMSDGGATITERGFCWSTSANPTTADSKVIVAGTTGIFTGTMSTLTENTLYHYRAYATNSVGTSYSNDLTFTTLRTTGRKSMPLPWDNLGVCVGNNINTGGTQTIAGSQDDVDYHASVGIKHVRMAGMGYDYTYGANAGGYGLSQQAIIEERVRMYLAQGITVQYNWASFGNWTLANPHTIGYELTLADQAVWAQSIGITRFQIENEHELHLAGGVTHQQSYDWLQTLPAIVRGAGFTGTITYSTGYDFAVPWRTYGKGNFDDLGLDHYGSNNSYVTVNTLSKAIWGEDCYLSEWNVNNSGIIWDFYKQDPSWLREQIRRYLSHIKVYFPNKVNFIFTWKNANDGPFDALSARGKDSNITRLFWYYLTGQRSPIVW